MSHWRNDSMHYNNSNDSLRTNPWPLHRSRQPQQHQSNSQPYPSFLPQSETSPSPYRLQPSEGNWRSPKGSLPSNALLFTSVMPKNIGVPYHQQYSTGSSSDTPNITATTTTTTTTSPSYHHTQTNSSDTYYNNPIYQTGPQGHIYPPLSQPQSQSSYEHPQTQLQPESNQAYHQGSFYAGQPQYATEQNFNTNAPNVAFDSNFSAQVQPLSTASSVTSWDTAISSSNMIPSSSSRSTQSLQLTRQPSAQEDRFGLNIDQIEFEVAHLWNLAVDVARKLNSGC